MGTEGVWIGWYRDMGLGKAGLEGRFATLAFLLAGKAVFFVGCEMNDLCQDFRFFYTHHH